MAFVKTAFVPPRLEAKRLVPVAFVKVVFWRTVTPFTVRLPKRLRLVPEASVKLKVVTVEDPALKLPVRFSVVPEAFVYTRVARFVVPVTVRLPVIVKLPVDVPPLNWMAFVVVFPAFVTV
jgi:hypothetical protein